jgi:Fur family ferric uptake transcriptional regulator
MRLTANRIAGLLRKNGYKLTPQRHLMLRVMASSHGRLTPEDIYHKCLEGDMELGLVTIYRTLALLERLGLVCRTHMGTGSRSYIMRRPQEHHHHLICSECGRVVDFTGCDLSQLQDRLSCENGFNIDGHVLEFFGVCNDCQNT